jgi:hypothetical protein
MNSDTSAIVDQVFVRRHCPDAVAAYDELDRKWWIRERPAVKGQPEPAVLCYGKSEAEAWKGLADKLHKLIKKGE